MGNGLNKRNRFTDIVCMFPIFVFVLSIVLVRLHLFSMPLTDIYWTEAIDTTTLSDLFSYYKAMAILAAGCLSLLFSVIGYFKGQIHFKKCFLYVPALVYIAFVLISYFFSKYRYFALRGMQEHFEGTFVLLSYILMVLFVVNALDSEKRIKYIIFCVLGVVGLLGFLGITQATGHDFFATVFGQKLITPNYTLDTGIKSWDMIDILAASGQKAYDFTFAEGEVYQTVYNLNYVPMFLSLLIPLTAVLFIKCWRTDGKRALSVIFAALWGLLLYNFFAANSASGYFGFAASGLAVLIVFRHQLKQWIRPIICLIIILALIMGIMANRWLPEIHSLFGYFVDKVFADNAASVQYTFDNTPASRWAPIDYIITGKDELTFSIGGNEIRVTRDNSVGAYNIKDDAGNAIYMKEITSTAHGQNGSFELLDERFHDYVRLSLVRDDENTYLRFFTEYQPFDFKYDGENFVYVNKVGKEVSLDIIPKSKIINEKDYSKGSGRGNIWATTIPLLKNYIIVGAGADGFTFVYPQNDYAYHYNSSSGQSMTLVTDKAHNLYMQYWVNTGLISLLAWLTMVGYYLVGAVKQFRKRGFVDFCDFVNGGIFCGICGFLAVAFFNDGSVNTMPMFYTMLGTGLAINMRDKWPSDEPVGETSGSDGADPGERKKKGKKAKTAAEVMPEM